MRRWPGAPYNGPMSTTMSHAGWVRAGTFIEALARRDFAGLADLAAPDLSLRCVLPTRFVAESGADSIRLRMGGWFGGADSFTLEEAAVGLVGTRIRMSWRVRLTDAGGTGRIAEQHAFMTDTPGGISHLDLVCSGFQEVTS